MGPYSHGPRATAKACPFAKKALTRSLNFPSFIPLKLFHEFPNLNILVMHGTTIIVRTCVVCFLEYNKSHYNCHDVICTYNLS